MNTVKPSAKRHPQPELHVNKQTSTSGQVSIHTIVFPVDVRSQRNESQHSIRAKSLSKRQHPPTKSKSLQMSGVPIKGSPPMKRNVKQGSQISSPNHKVQDKATCANKATHRNNHTLPQQESTATHQSASLTTVSSHPPTPDSLQIYTPFLNWHRSDPVTTDSKSLVFITLVSMVRDGYEFDEENLQTASSFLSFLMETNQRAQDIDSFIQAIGQGSTNPAAVFVDLMTILLSSPHPLIFKKTFNFVRRCFEWSSPSNCLALLTSKLIPKVLSTPSPRNHSIFKDEYIIHNIVMILQHCLLLTSANRHPFYNAASNMDPRLIRDVVLHDVLIPSEGYLVQISYYRHLWSWKFDFEDRLRLLTKIFEVSPFHQPTLNFVCSSRIPMVLQTLLSKVEDQFTRQNIIWKMNRIISGWKINGAETVGRGRILLQTLEREGFRDHLEQTLFCNKRQIYAEDIDIRDYSFQIMTSLGINCHIKR